MAYEKLTAEEQEVCINYNKADDTAIMYISDTTQIKKIDKMCEAYPDTYICKQVHKLSNGEIVGKTYEFPKKLVSLRKPNKKMKLTEEEKTERMKNLNKKS